MRTTMLVVLCSFASGCAPLGNPGGGGEYDGDGPDGGVDGGAVGGPCTNVETLTMNLSIAGEAGFKNLPTSCWKLNGTLTLAGPAVTSVAKLGDLREVTHLEINDTELTTFDSVSPVEVTGDLWVRYNEKLTDITKVVSEGTVDSITIEHNPALTSLGGVSKVTIVAGQTTIRDNSKLSAIDLSSAQRLEDGLYVGDNTSAKSLDISRLQSVDSLSIVNNSELTTITTPSNLTNVHGSLTIDNNDKLTSLGQFGTATVITQNLIVTGNLNLADLGQLSHAGSIGLVQITGNNALHPTRAHDVGCCVITGGFTAGANMNAQCSGNHWCNSTQECFR